MSSHTPDFGCDTCKAQFDQLERLADYLDEHEWRTESVAAFAKLEGVPADTFTVHCCNMPEEV